ncbi:hypothetical protein [Paenibacillus piri]|uniref:Uncharacterized protein n=1 Tax=Paenibacillus piri TaxID=2547395 RepID=A0A4R5KD51_9BACL|nr:hypothetical protein [Paenibacillus piri]TDF93269.1 hypothetical protein E1757_27690 [Paenibacillus piri]
MNTVIVVCFILLVIYLISRNGKSRDVQRGGGRYAPNRSVQPLQSIPYANTPLPAMLGIQPHLPLQAAVARLEQSLPESFLQRLKERVLGRYPQMSDAEYEWKLLELKRYFLMTAILKDVPMFSQQVDDLWHEMLMFTREYSQFGEAFVGAPIHHAPHTEGQPDPGGRAWFDWTYAQLFVHTPYSGRIWRPFFRHPLDPALLDELKLNSEEELLAAMFNRRSAERYPEIRETALLLIRTAKDQAAEAGRTAAYTAERPAFGADSYMPYLAGALMFYSMTQFTDFSSHMEPLFAEEEAQRRMQDAAAGLNGSASSCGSGCSSWGDDDDRSSGSDCGGSGGDNGGDSGSGSSCSSSSCSSSSCGGGGD